MTGSLPSTRDVIKKALRVLKPGGWLEWHDIDPVPRCDDNTVPPPNTDGGFSEYALHDWIELEVKAAEEYEPYRQFLIADKLAAEMRQEGPLGIHVQTVSDAGVDEAGDRGISGFGEKVYFQ
ncbi:hypothetical protein F66182_12696 [Fusarium sp. NRRL 66182]|nr:hypothetical protein F66182_12696 [Fusarium sp. NRRL 66182]